MSKRLKILGIALVLALGVLGFACDNDGDDDGDSANNADQLPVLDIATPGERAGCSISCSNGYSCSASCPSGESAYCSCEDGVPNCDCSGRWDIAPPGDRGGCSASCAKGNCQISCGSNETAVCGCSNGAAECDCL